MAARDLLEFLDENDPTAGDLETALAASELRQKYGGQWANHPDYDPETWVREVVEGNTRLSYWEWVAAEIDCEAAGAQAGAGEAA